MGAFNKNVVSNSLSGAYIHLYLADLMEAKRGAASPARNLYSNLALLVVEAGKPPA